MQSKQLRQGNMTLPMFYMAQTSSGLPILWLVIIKYLQLHSMLCIIYMYFSMLQTTCMLFKYMYIIRVFCNILCSWRQILWQVTRLNNQSLTVCALYTSRLTAMLQLYLTTKLHNALKEDIRLSDTFNTFHYRCSSAILRQWQVSHFYACLHIHVPTSYHTLLSKSNIQTSRNLFPWSPPATTIRIGCCCPVRGPAIQQVVW